MSIETVRNYFKQFGIENNIIEFDVSSATVELAAKAIGCTEGEIAKTLAFKNKKSGEGFIIVVTSGDVKIDNTKFKQTFSMKATLIPPPEVAEITSHEVGGVCPFAIPDGIPVYLDESLKKYETIYPACGSHNSAIKLTWREIEKYASGDHQWVHVTKERDA
ncbi:MAG: YbaK/EbsC family protein [Fusobacteriaceae bacterium]|jgi:prolyl-tRNA editing enzyme YbaK/EbsC (Cys-tRNA(Pro) deacylase)|nr:YbaK/EbsC family protein [Fusobacteriaceae bacterium]